MIGKFFFALMLALLCLSMAASENDKSVSSKESGYTVYCPEGWEAARVYYRPDVVDERIREHVLLWNESRAYISVDVWKTTITGDISLWLRVCANSDMEQYQLEKTTATAEKLDAYLYRSIAQKQAYNSQMIYFKRQESVFRVSYWECDGGQSDSVYRAIVDKLSFSDAAEPMPEMSRSIKIDSRIYSCGGYNDTCNCGMNNPYPCCDNNSNCTWWAWHKACCVWVIGLPSPWRHAKYWATDLSGHGYLVSSTPAVNTIACRDIGTYGHVAWVEEVSGNRIKVSEMNCCEGCHAGMRYQWYDASYFTGGFIYKK